MSSADIHLMGQSVRGREPFFVSLFVCREMCVLPVNGCLSLKNSLAQCWCLLTGC